MSRTNAVGTPHNNERKHILGGGTLHILFGVGTPHNIYKKSLAVSGWYKPENNATLFQR